MSSLARNFVFAFLLSCLTCGALWAQVTAQISGTVKDASGAVLPGVEVTATQTATGLVRTAVSNETGSYILSNLPVGPYKLEAALAGFRTFVQTGIVLQVDANPVLNITLEVGQVSETVEVQADAALVETRSTGISQVMENARILELPLHARQVTDLIIASGAAVGGGVQNSPRNYPTDIISVGGGSNDGLAFLLDGAVHNDPYGNQALPLPFPDALQEFKIETSAIPAQYGYHAAGTINVVTKSGTNQFHGSAFEFVRNRVFNARNAFATERDPLKRNQFGGVIGGPVLKDKLFFFGGMQTTLQRSISNGLTTFLPTPPMLAGDWTAYASAACQSTGAVTLRAPFVGNRIDPNLFSKPAVDLVKRLNVNTLDQCGKVQFGGKANNTEYFPVAKMDYQASDKHSLFGRYELAQLDTPSDYDGKSIVSMSSTNYARRVNSFALGDTYSISPTTVSSFRGAILRTSNVKSIPEFFTFSDLGVQNLFYPPNYPKTVLVNITGSARIGGNPPATPGVTNSTVYQFSEDVSHVRGAHQIGYGASFIHSMMNYTASTTAAGSFAFTGITTGLGLGDLLVGKANSYTQSKITNEYYRQNYFALYLQDTWKATAHLTLNGGVRWEPYMGPYDAAGKQAFFDRTRFDQGITSQFFKKAPAGIYFQGEGGIPDTNAFQANHPWHFAPRLGLAWDPKGDGKTVIRAAYGLLYDLNHLHEFGGKRDTSPKGASIVVNSPSFENPWVTYTGGNPFPIALNSDTPFPLTGVYTVVPWNLKKPYMNQWNLAVQHQFGSNWLVAGNYLGNNTIHMLYRYESNPAVYIPGASTVGNTNQRRVLYLQNPAAGQYYSYIVTGDDGATRNYNALVLQVTRRRAAGLTIQGNYTYSHCIDDGYNDVIQTNGGNIPSRRRADRGNCELDRRHNFNLSAVYEIPRWSNRTVRALASGWQISGIARVVSGPFRNTDTGIDQALTGTLTAFDQRPNQVLGDPYLPNKGPNGWLNPAAFQQSALGTYGNAGSRNVVGPGVIRFDMGVTRTFAIRESQSVQFRAEVFNVSNHVNFCAGTINGVAPSLTCPDMNLSSPTFGKLLHASDPRIMQVALKFVF
jgi:carboxypeptidase family protein